MEMGDRSFERIGRVQQMNQITYRHVFVLFFSLFLTALGGVCQAQGGTVEWGSHKWVLVNAEIDEHLGRQALTGMAYIEGSDFQDGVIEFDIAVDGTRGYPGISFRAANQFEYESFYIRPHQNNLPDAMQYCPVFKSVSSWQLYNGDGFNAPMAIPVDEWIHIKLEIKGTQGRVFVGDGEEPNLVINELKHGVQSGSIGIISPKNGAAYFSNFEFRADDGLQFDPAPAPVPPLGLVRSWEISQPFQIADVEREDYPSPEDLDKVQWQTVTADAEGLVDVGLYVPRSRTGEADCIYARTFIESDEDEVRQFAFGYSDVVNVFVNEQIVFSGNRMYKSRSASFLGAIGLGDAIFLPLQKGQNELMFVLFEVFGGWGLMAQDKEADYLADGVSKVWETKRDLKYPESVVYDRERDILYVSNFFGGRGGFISKMTVDGKIETLSWVSGLVRPTGMVIHGDILYVIDRINLIEIDIETGEITNRYPAPNPGFINDVVVDASDNVYISDNDGNKIWKFRDGGYEVWLEGDEVLGPNGLFIDGDKLLYGNTDGDIKVVDLTSKQIRTLTNVGWGSNIDGFKLDGQGNYLISDFNGRIFRVTRTGDTKEILNLTSSGTYCADFEYIPEKDLLLVPSLYDNRVAAWRYQAEQ
jgi:sugar lactone lactonase YvrE